MSVYGRRWRVMRLAVLQRDGHQCQMRLPGCTTHATTVDHIVRLMDGGDMYNPTNLRAACAHCNASDGGRAARARHSSGYTW